tara:strand:- start:1056 stop:2192 length:1137 start_codon:yes stop_codon:yes gene_type:complete
MKQQKICIIGNGLAGLISAAVLSKEDIKIDLIFPKAKSIKIDHRTTAISESNYSFLKKELNFKNLKYVWSSKKINLFYQRNEKFLKFLNFSEKNKTFMYIFRNFDLKKTLLNIIKKKKNIKIIKESVNTINYENSSVFLKRKNVFYDLIILSLGNNSSLYDKIIGERSINKNYNEIAITAFGKHNSKVKNASQFFLKEGPFALLPLKNNILSIVWSVNQNFFKKNKKNLKKIILKKMKDMMGQSFKINIKNLNNFPIYLNLKKNYYKKNILVIGDGLHRVHPLAGQGFNLALRDIAKLKELIKNNLRLGLLMKDSLIFNDFYKTRKPENTIVGIGIDLTNNFFKENKIYLPLKDLILKNINNSQFVKKISQSVSDIGI